jgi:hypothetical protein
MNAACLKSASTLSVVLLANGVMLGACQGLADEHTGAPPLASIQGTLSLAPSTQAPTGDVKLAIMWDLYPGQGPSSDTRDPSNPCAVDPSKLAKNPRNVGGYDFPGAVGYHQFQRAFAEQQISIETAFPVQFTLNITEPPSPEALHAPAPYFKSSLFASGQFVVYRDGNSNGKLDASTFESPSPDELLSASAGGILPAPSVTHTLEYIDRKPVFDLQAAQRDGLGEAHIAGDYRHQFDDLQPGYNLIELDADGSPPRRVADDTSIALNPTPFAQLQLCAESCQKPDDFVCPANPADLPTPENRAHYSRSETGSSWYYFDEPRTHLSTANCIELSSGQRYFDYTSAVCESCVCETRECAYWSHKLPEGVSLPCSGYSHSDGVPPDSMFAN